MKFKFGTRAVHAAMAVALSAGAATAVQAAPTVQNGGPGGEDSYWWTWDSLAQVSFATGTNQVLALTSQVTLVDQGWGGQDAGNGVFMSLDVNGDSVWNRLVAGSSHDWSTQNYDIANDADGFASLNTALANIDWSANPDVDMSLRQRGYGYPGWALHTTNASFSVTSDAAAVPEPAAWAMMILGMGAVGYAMRRRQKVATRVSYAA